MLKDKKTEKKNKKCHLRHGLRIIGFILLTIFLYFWCIGILRTFVEYIHSNDSLMGLPKPFFYFIFSMGVSAFIIAIFEKKLSKHYLYCHELTHALVGLLTGSKISNLKVKEDRASVKVSKPNLIVILAPYIVSLHVVLALFLYGCVVIAVPDCNGYVHSFFTILIGICSAYHFVFTTKSLLQKQSDIERVGFFLSYLLIVTLNLAGLMTIFTCIDSLSFNSFISTSLAYTADTITKLWLYLF
jgi:hypothetical protein